MNTLIRLSIIVALSAIAITPGLCQVNPVATMGTLNPTSGTLPTFRLSSKYSNFEHVDQVETATERSAMHFEGGYIVDESPLVNTSGSFGVSAWVKVNKLGGFQSFVSLDGDQISAFFLQLRQDTGKFAFTVPGAPTGDGGVIASAGFTPRTGVWYWLFGVHDAAKKTISLYVNGVLQQTTNYTSAFRGTGHTAIGRGKFGGRPVDFCQADLRDVSFYDNAKLNPTELDRIATLTKSNSSTITVDATQPTHALSPMLYGLMIEDINYCIDGGLYAELIRNRVFKNSANTPVHWTSIGSGRMLLDNSNPIAGTALTTCLRLDSPGSAAASVANDGYWGIPVTPNTKYRASFYAKSSNPGRSVTASIQSNDGTEIWASASVGGLTSNWKKYTVTLTTGANASAGTGNRFVLTTNGAGSCWFNQVSLFPPTFNNRPNGTRLDLMQILGSMKPAFLRLPGGNYLEGNTIAERFNWRETIGDISQRPGHQDPWGYRSDDGFGLLEYLEWCEDLKMEPVLAVYAGYSLRGEHVAAGPKLEPFIAEALEEIEYVMGGPETIGGAKRIKNGHPKPFALRYVEIGNEDNFDRSGSYDGRFAAFYDAIKLKFPKLQLIATDKVKSRKPDMMDEHFYRTAATMAGDADHYDKYDRTGPKVFVGEWASQDIDKPWERAAEKGPTPTLNSALGDAAWMTGMERNSDIVLLSCYAPLFVNVNPGGRQWAINLIGFDALRSFASPSFYAQQMFSLYHGDEVLKSSVEGLIPLQVAVSRDKKKGTIYVKVVNMNGKPQDAEVDLKGISRMKPIGKRVVLSGTKLSDTNTIDDPKHVVPVTSTFAITGPRFKYTFPAYSASVLVIETGK
ncbi:MAG: alpha-L-arabinofuranosidase C-terminal domain-containing protein [Chthonomonadales bacterium]